MNWLFVVIVLLLAQREYMASPTPLKLPGHTQKLTPYIRHWEAANFDREALIAAHQKHTEQKHQRRKRELNAREFGPAHTIRVKFNAHDREFRVVLRQDPLSVFARDVHIESTYGPLDYDISRVYTGRLEDDESSHVHAILTNDNLLDGTIETNLEQFYLEPAYRYSQDLYDSGVHSIVYKVSDVNMKHFAAAADSEHCASDRLRRSADPLGENLRSKRVYKNIPKRTQLYRRKRWLPDEFSSTDEDRQYPPLPLDLDMPYNDDFNTFSHITNRYPMEKPTTTTKFDNKMQHESVITWRNNAGNRGSISAVATPITKTNTRAHDYARNNESNNSSNYGGHIPYIKNTNIVYTKNIYRSNSNQPAPPFEHKNKTTKPFYSNGSSYNPFSNNETTRFVSNDRPSHKTHVEIITKNGATKKPNIIVNNYNPDIMLAPNPHNPNFKSMTNFLIGRGQEAPQDIDSSTTKSVYDRKITCMLYLQADHTFFQKMGSDEASIEAITRHVQRANSIYKNTDFNRDGKPDNITFMIKRIKVHNMNAINDPTYRFPGNYGVEKFLELFSEEDYDAFCLAYMFTYRDFEMGTLGLAWTGDLKNAGGVCEKNGHYRGSLKSLNTGIVTLLNYGKHVPPAVSHVTLAHEIGHNFGSPHDPDQCTPGGEDGNFIMFARATSGDKKNNHRFSPCSLKSIDPVLSAKARSTKGCFTEPQTSICGNGVVEPGEQCDCGWEEDCKDTCCFPMSRHHRFDENPCTLTPSAMCSPSQGPCCTTGCKLKFGDKCRDDNGCRDPSFCDGRMPQCPPSLNKPNKTICNKEFVCYMGECTGSICLAYGLESCQCIPGQQDDKIKSCELCCKLPGESNPCRSSFEWNESPFDVPDMYAKPGTPCNDYNGYCDVFQKCREVDPSGPLATLRKLLLSEESIATFKKWMQQNWYTVAFAVFGVLILLILSTKLLAKRSNLKLKSVTIIHSATTETVRLPDDSNDVIVHTAVRTKVPFKKKVRGERVGSKNKVSNSSGENKAKSNSAGKTCKAGLKPAQSHSRGAKVGLPTLVAVATTRDLKKPVRSGNKNRISSGGINEKDTTVAAAAKTVDNEATSPIEVKKTKKAKRSSKEVIDYSSNNTSIVGGSYTNTFSKVQKWLLESPIVTQPLSRIEHSSKIMNKSQSTPERLLQKSPQKSKSTGNVSKEKVKLQVVYKPPFKFSLRMSRNAKIKTQVIGGTGSGGAGGGCNNAKRPLKTAIVSERKRLSKNQNDENNAAATFAKSHHAALVLRSTSKEDNDKMLPVSEPNYETLTAKVVPTKHNNPVYANDCRDSLVTEVTSANKNINVSRRSKSSSKRNAETNASGQPQRTQSSSRPNSLSANSRFVAVSHGSLRKTDASLESSNHNFSSTQNLIIDSQSDLSKAKRRSGLSLNTARNAKDPSAFQVKRSSSNIKLGRENSATNIEKLSEDVVALASSSLAGSATQHSVPLRRNSSNTIPQQSLQQLPSHPSAVITTNAVASERLLPYLNPRSSRNNFSNIPRVSINSNSSGSCTNSISNFSFNGPVSPNAALGGHAGPADGINHIANNHTNYTEQSTQLPAEQRRTRSNMQSTPTNASVSAASAPSYQRVNSTQKQQHNSHPQIPALPHPTAAGGDGERMALGDLEVMVSEVRNLVS